MQTFAAYDHATNSTAMYHEVIRQHMDPIPLLELSYLSLGLIGESGEVANKIKKVLRTDATLSDSRSGILLELGDILWYTSQLALSLGSTLEEIATLNHDKLINRQQKKTIQGSGDDR